MNMTDETNASDEPKRVIISEEDRDAIGALGQELHNNLRDIIQKYWPERQIGYVLEVICYDEKGFAHIGTATSIDRCLLPIVLINSIRRSEDDSVEELKYPLNH